MAYWRTGGASDELTEAMELLIDRIRWVGNGYRSVPAPHGLEDVVPNSWRRVYETLSRTRAPGTLASGLVS